MTVAGSVSMLSRGTADWTGPRAGFTPPIAPNPNAKSRSLKIMSRAMVHP
jgi:hypothetical protein